MRGSEEEVNESSEAGRDDAEQLRRESYRGSRDL